MKTIVFNSSLRAARQVGDKVLAHVRELGYSDESLFAIKLAMEEALTNAVKHGNVRNPRKKITVRYSMDRSRVIVVVADEGKGFHPDDVPDPTINENLECPSGRGIMLMRAYMDQVDYSETGNEVRMVKQNT